jgi:hypothetical protein
MRRIVRTALWLVAAGVITMFVIVGSVSFVVWRHTSITKPAAAEADGVFTMIRERYKGRTPLIELKDPTPPMIGVKINRPPATAQRQNIKHFHVAVWDSRQGTFVRSSVPVWWMQFNANNVLTNLGVPLGGYNLSVQDVERYGPGIIIDFQPPGGGHMLVWVE